MVALEDQHWTSLCSRDKLIGSCVFCMSVLFTCIPVFHSRPPWMVFSAYQLTKEPRGLRGQTDQHRVLFVCLSHRCVCVCEVVWILGYFSCDCVQVWELRPGTSLAGELKKTSVPTRGHASTSVIKTVVTDSKTLRVLPPFMTLLKSQIKVVMLRL